MRCCRLVVNIRTNWCPYLDVKENYIVKILDFWEDIVHNIESKDWILSYHVLCLNLFSFQEFW